MDLKLEDVTILKKVTAACPWHKMYQTIDMKLDMNGVMEDQFYSRVPQLIKNVRRGNTILEIKDENGQIGHHIGRKGLMKFFDMRLDFISKE